MRSETIRCYPSKKELLPYPERYNKAFFDKCNEAISDEDYIKNYDMLIEGINPKTKKKISTVGRTYKKMLEEYEHQYDGVYGLFKALKYISYENYSEETKNIKKSINEQNIDIKKYNIDVEETVHKIKLLKDWNNFIDFDGKKYGLPKILDNIHKENNCDGKMIFTNSETDNNLNDKTLYNYNDRETIDSYYNCEKCNTVFSKKLINFV